MPQFTGENRNRIIDEEEDTDVSENDAVLYRKEQEIGYVTINRPQALNALNRAVLEKLSAILDSAREDASVKALIITGSGEKAFSAGADIDILCQASPLEVRALAQLAVAVYNRIETLGKTVAAAMNGYALGGGLELAEACTFRIAASHAKLGHPEVRIGAVAGWGGMTRLPRLIGLSRATELLLTGRPVTAEEAYHLGLVHRVVESATLLEETRQFIAGVLSQAPVAVRMTLEALYRGQSLSPEESTALGADYFGLVATTDDFREGTGAFLRKTRPLFKGI